VRSVTMGISAIIDGNGRVQLPRLVSDRDGVKKWEVFERNGRVPDLPESRWADFKKVGGVLVATVPIDERTSLYILLGDWFAWLCWAVVGGGLAWGLLRRRQPLRPALAAASVVGPVRLDAPVSADAPRPNHGKPNHGKP
jgi:apolipoprotein N-acyltransferase